MTKSHIWLYVIAVLGITLAAYMYTSIAEAPHGLTLDEASSLPSSELVPAPSISTSTDADEEATEELPNEAVTSQPASSLLTGRTWRWLHTEDKSGLVIFEPKQSEAYKMQFTENRMSSLTDCNTVGAAYTLEGQNLSFGPIMSTLMYCDGSDEATYGAGLALITSYEIVVDKLKLMTSAGEVMVFTDIGH